MYFSDINWSNNLRYTRSIACRNKYWVQGIQTTIMLKIRKDIVISIKRSKNSPETWESYIINDIPFSI